jgi:hypothetical protein
MNILESKSFDTQLEELKNVPFECKVLRGSMSLEQTKRNLVRRELVEGLGKWLEEHLGSIVNIYEVKEGIAIEVENQSALNSGAGDGFITLLLDLSIQSLEYSAYEQAEMWIEDKANAAEKAKIKAEEAAAKEAKAKAKKAKATN